MLELNRSVRLASVGVRSDIFARVTSNETDEVCRTDLVNDRVSELLKELMS